MLPLSKPETWLILIGMAMVGFVAGIYCAGGLVGKLAVIQQAEEITKQEVL